MRISLHGGNCCGVKHIHELGQYPNTKVAARKGTKVTSFGQKHSIYGYLLSSGMNDMRTSNSKKSCDFFNLAAPQETYAERLKRFVQFIKDNRPNGIIEVIINLQQTKWKPILEELGFKSVSSGKNSNTGSTITIYHLVY